MAELTKIIIQICVVYKIIIPVVIWIAALLIYLIVHIIYKISKRKK